MKECQKLDLSESFRIFVEKLGLMSQYGFLKE